MSNQRFYDRDQSVCAAVNLTRQLPQDFQGLIAGGINTVAIRDHQADERMSHLKSLGAEKILPLYKSKNKRRDYDSVPEFHTAMNYLRILEENERRKVADTVLELVEFANHYLEKCRYTACIPDPKKIEQVRDSFLGMETAKALQYLETVRKEVLSTLMPAKAQDGPKAGYVADGNTIHLGEF